ncbi:MAG: hypothetical protein IT308_07230 [Anaerolineaceae bacterium]|nr:hypothetical protein [Anaerolineaceae bacterium]
MTHPASDLPSPNPPTRPNQQYSVRRIRFGLIITLLGFAIFLIGTKPGISGLDRSPIIGFVQIAVFIIGLAFICLGGYISLMALWNRRPPSIAADFGLRIVATGFVIVVFSGMADVFGFGSHPLPGVPFFGGWQARGVMIGEALIAIGFLLLIPYAAPKSLEPPPPPPQ